MERRQRIRATMLAKGTRAMGTYLDRRSLIFDDANDMDRTASLACEAIVISLLYVNVSGIYQSLACSFRGLVMEIGNVHGILKDVIVGSHVLGIRFLGPRSLFRREVLGLRSGIFVVYVGVYRCFLLTILFMEFSSFEGSRVRISRSDVIDGLISEHLEIVISKGSRHQLFRAYDVLSLSQSATEGRRLETCNRANLTSLTYVIHGSYVRYYAQDASFHTGNPNGFGGGIGVLATTSSRATHGCSLHALSVSLTLFSLTTCGLCRGIYVDRGEVCIGELRRSIGELYGDFFLRRALTRNDRLKAIFEIRSNDSSVTTRYEASLMGGVLVFLFLIYVIASFGANAIDNGSTIGYAKGAQYRIASSRNDSRGHCLELLPLRRLSHGQDMQRDPRRLGAHIIHGVRYEYAMFV